MKIGENIKKMRELKGYTQEEMASKLNISQNGYSKIEREETDVQFSRLVQISQALEIDLLDLIAFDGQRLLFNVSNTNNHTGFAYLNNDLPTILKEVGKQYEARIEAQQKEIDRLHTLLEKALTR
jgi:transcriptional regulator with XRE-family HTH domain